MGCCSIASLLLLVCVLCCLSVSADQSYCVVGGVKSPCPTIDSHLERWGVSFRLYAPVDVVLAGSIEPITSIMESFNATFPLVSSYFAGKNSKSAVIPTTVPFGLFWLEFNETHNIFFPMAFLPDAYLNVAPDPLDPDVTILEEVAWNPVVFTWSGIPTDDVIETMLSLLIGVLVKHKSHYIADLYGMVVYSADPAIQQQGGNEVWVFPENEQNLAFRKHLLNQITLKQE